MMASGIITSKISLALHTLNQLMRHLPAPCSGSRVHDLFLLAVTAGNCHGDIRLLHLYLGHDQPPASSCNFRLSASIVSHLSTAATPPLGAEASMLACFEQIFGVTWRKAFSCLPPFSETQSSLRRVSGVICEPYHKYRPTRGERLCASTRRRGFASIGVALSVVMFRAFGI